MNRAELTKHINEISSLINAIEVSDASEAKQKAIWLMAMALVGTLLVDVHRIADALESLVDTQRNRA